MGPKIVEGFRVLQESEKARAIYRRPNYDCLALRLPRAGETRRQALKTGMFFRCVAIDYSSTKDLPNSMWIANCDRCPGAVKMRGTKSGRYAYKVKPKIMVNRRTGKKKLWKGAVELV